MEEGNPFGYRMATDAEIEQSRHELVELHRQAVAAMERNGTRTGPHPRVLAIKAAAAARRASQEA